MSENQEFEASVAPSFDAATPSNGINETLANKLKALDQTIESQSYFLGEVPQPNLVDPNAYLPLNSDRLVGPINALDKVLSDTAIVMEEEVSLIQKHQKRIAYWEERIELNKVVVKKNEAKIKQNHIDALYDKKNRDYWLGRSEEVEIDYSHAESSNRQQDWSWLIKKYGLKNANGTEIEAKNSCVDELCNGATSNLSGEYKGTGEKYEQQRQAKEAENRRLVHENAKFLNTNETLQNYIVSTYSNEIEPLQDGVLLLKELSVKLKALNGDSATFGELRIWAEGFLNDFLKANPRVPQNVVTHFRKLTSIPLPPEFC